ncbi:MAG: C4-dicarboxylate ABC transporter permease, partial [Alphaproteobacteria bacterium HGW-Alphaproteobacteria-12]
MGDTVKLIENSGRRLIVRLINYWALVTAGSLAIFFGFIPGLMIVLLFCGYIFIRCLINPALAPRAEDHYTWKDRLQAIPAIAPVVLLVFLVLGSIYLGWATPTEAGGVGVVGALFFAAVTRSLSWQVFKTSMINSIKTSCMIMLIVMGASYLS